MFKRLIAAALVFGTSALAPPATAQSYNCMPRERLITNLQDNFGENLTGRGLQNPGQLLEIFSSESSGSFTIFVTSPQGFSCVLATGANWLDYLPPKDDLES